MYNWFERFYVRAIICFFSTSQDRPSYYIHDFRLYLWGWQCMLNSTTFGFIFSEVFVLQELGLIVCNSSFWAEVWKQSMFSGHIGWWTMLLFDLSNIYKKRVQDVCRRTIKLQPIIALWPHSIIPILSLFFVCYIFVLDSRIRNDYGRLFWYSARLGLEYPLHADQYLQYMSSIDVG